MRVSDRAGEREKEKGGGGWSETGTVRRAALSDRQEPGQTLTHTHTQTNKHTDKHIITHVHSHKQTCMWTQHCTYAHTQTGINKVVQHGRARL